MEDHRFGESDYLNANDFDVGQRIEVKASSFVGRKEYEANQAGAPTKKKKAGFYMVDDHGLEKEFRLTMQNERAMKKKFKLTKYEDAVGRIFVLEVKKYTNGNGFILVALK